jgi:hypothetical protein
LFKKAGIVVGVTIILIACSLYWWVGTMDKPKVGETTSPTEVVQKEPKPVKPDKEVVPEKKPEPTISAVTQPTVVEPLPTTPIEGQSQVFSILDDSDLGEPLITRTEIMVVSNKKVVLMDSNYGTEKGKQLVYAVDLIYGEGLLTLYLNGVMYESLTVGDKLKVQYDVFKNDSGVSFPTITSVDLAN